MSHRHSRIILVEDDQDLRESLLEYLQLTGYQVDGAGSALEFYHHLARHPYAVAILDIGLPDQDGLMLAAYLRQNSRTRIIILSAHTGIDDRIKGYRSGADTYLVKPVDGRELAAAIDSQLQRDNSDQRRTTAASPAADPLAAADAQPRRRWFFAPSAWLLTTPGGARIELSGKEMELMTLLMRQPGEIVRREEILAQLYQRDDDHANRALESLVRRLRQKIADHDPDNPIKTCWGTGYCFSTPAATGK